MQLSAAAWRVQFGRLWRLKGAGEQHAVPATLPMSIHQQLHQVCIIMPGISIRHSELVLTNAG